MPPTQPSIRRDVTSGLVAVTVPYIDSAPTDMEWFTLSLDALDDAGARARLTNDPSQGIVTLESTGASSDHFLTHLARALTGEEAPAGHMAERTAITIADDLTTDDDIDALQVVYAATFGPGREMQIVIDLDDESVTFALHAADATAFVAHLAA